MKKKSILISIVLILLCLITISTVNANDINNNPVIDDSIVVDETNIPTADEVNVADDEIDDSNSNLSPLEKFRQDFNDGNKSTIYLEDNIKIKETFKNSRELTIDGKNHIIDGNKKQIFRNSGKLTLKNIIFKNAKADIGSAIYNYGSLKVENCQFIDNVASKHGAAIHSTGGSLTIVNSKFTHNLAYNTNGGALSSNTKNTLVKNCIFKNNAILDHSTKVRGGAAFFGQDSKIIGCTFTNNYCDSTYGTKTAHSKTNPSTGGAIAFYEGKHTVTNCKFNKNHVDNHGGAIFGSNKVKSLTITKCEFNSNKATYEDGGAISYSGDKLTISNSKFKNNYAKEDGGAIDTYSADKSKVVVNINKCIFDSNTAHKGAGAVWLGTITHYTIKNSEFKYNKATVGGAIFIEGKSAKISSCKFIKNSVKSYTKYSKSKTAIKPSGGAISIKSKLTLSNCEFDGNKATVVGGAIYNKAAMTVSSSKFYRNSAKYGGGVYHDGKKSSLTKNIFYANSASGSGGGIFAKTNKITIKYNAFLSNKAKTSKAVQCKKKISLNNNWWGSANAKKGPGKLTNMGVSSWFYLKGSASPTKIAKGKQTTIILDLRNTNTHKKIGSSAKLPVTFTATSGNLASKSSNIVNGLSKIKFEKTGTTGKVVANVLGVKLTITIK